MKPYPVFFVLILVFGIIGCTNGGQGCESKPDEDSRFVCYISEARKNNDPKPCENLPNGSVGYTRDKCYLYLIYYQYLNLDGIQCNRLNDSEKTQCLLEIENRKKNPEICGKMDNPSKQRNTCFNTVAYFTGNLSFCDKLEDSSERDRCYDGVAEITLDVTICEKIVGYEDRQWCYVFVARRAKDPSYCNKLDPQYTPDNMSVIDYCLKGARDIYG